jgi:hypothetical protein
MMLIGEAVARLATLETPEKVAQFLQSEGVRGTRSSPMHCPLTLWIRRATDIEVSVNVVDPDLHPAAVVHTWPLPLLTEELKPAALLSPACTAFLYLFDRGLFPMLEAQS